MYANHLQMSHAHHDHAHCIHSALSEAEAYCTTHNLRFTDIRRRIFSIIWQSHKALTAHEIMTLLGNSQPPITYRALEFLHSNGLVHHVTSLNAYVGCQHVGQHIGSQHTGQLLICTDCHLVTEIDQQIPQLTAAANNAGFTVTQMQVEVLGQCRDCQTHAAK